MRSYQQTQNNRAVIEEDYGRRLLKLSKAPFGKDETGTLREALETTRTELETSGNAHIEIAQRIRDELELQLGNFIAQQKEKKREVHYIFIMATKIFSLRE